MKNIKKTIAAIMIIGIILLGTNFANAGIIVAGATKGPATGKTTQSCTQSSGKVNHGIIVAGLTGIIVAGFTGIIVAGFTGIIVAGAVDTTTTNCGIIVAG